MKKAVMIIAALLVLAGCMNKAGRKHLQKKAVDFDVNLLRNDLQPAAGTNGQLLYLPVYSNIPYLIDTGMFDMSAFVAVHNTDLRHQITLSKVLYFNQDGKLVDDFLREGSVPVSPLATKNFYIPYEDQSGTGANFLIEWIADTIVNEPLVESVTLCLKPNNTLAIQSKGRVIRQNRK